MRASPVGASLEVVRPLEAPPVLPEGNLYHPLIAQHLTVHDDPEFWDVATGSLLAEAEASAAGTTQDVYAQIGCCHHWISPHAPSRWVAGARVAWPFGYDKTTTRWSCRTLPELTWSEHLKWADGAWEPGRTGKRCLVFRIAIPARTARHSQAAIHTIWTPRSPRTNEKVVQVFGFRKRDGEWSQTASEVIQLKKRHV
jgi:hypothetical protein